ncbi:hypothetical protein [Mucilaginibacter xinganensis]|uniref:Uncharacterized protein n=1 Tax=Mucilaginibacter xinganensis TaxID=1234841 RepID=A0A223NX29_9SPHI|nr:hypothetical protein [Mucilaginibacter xinganensis]ASU34433.1 hypothetical protein MuYL_2546 [Mucilaginibacter xinganensis]
MERISFSASFGDEIKQVTIIDVNKGSGGYQLLIDKYYYGDIIKVNGEWHLHSSTNLLTLDDIQAIGEIIENKKAL